MKKRWFLLFRLLLDLVLPLISYSVEFSLLFFHFCTFTVQAPHLHGPSAWVENILKALFSFMFYRISQHSTFLYLMNPKFTKVGIIEDQLIDSIYPAGTIYQKLGHRDGAFFSDSKMRTSFHPRLQQCLDGISVQERYLELISVYRRIHIRVCATFVGQHASELLGAVIIVLTCIE